MLAGQAVETTTRATTPKRLWPTSAQWLRLSTDMRRGSRKSSTICQSCRRSRKVCQNQAHQVGLLMVLAVVLAQVGDLLLLLLLLFKVVHQAVLDFQVGRKAWWYLL